MSSLSDRLLNAGCAALIEAVHGETVTVLNGANGGLVFTAVQEIESDIILNSELGEDPRAKRILRFRTATAPTLASQDIVQTADGKKWHAVRRPGAAYLTIDYELREIVAGLDT